MQLGAALHLVQKFMGHIESLGKLGEDLKALDDELLAVIGG